MSLAATNDKKYVIIAANQLAEANFSLMPMMSTVVHLPEIFNTA
jgi:hypothetical protein